MREKLENLIHIMLSYGNTMLFDTIMTIHVNSLKLLQMNEHKITLLYSDLTLQILILYALRVSSAIAEVISLRLGKLQ